MGGYRKCFFVNPNLYLGKGLETAVSAVNVKKLTFNIQRALYKKKNFQFSNDRMVCVTNPPDWKSLKNFN